MTVRRPLLLALAASAALAAGCGDDSDSANGGDEKQIREVFSTYTNALADKDYGTACAQLTDASKQAITAKLASRKDAIRSLTGAGEIPTDCPGQFRILLDSELAGPGGGDEAIKARDELLQASKKAQIDDIEISGDTGSVQVTIPLDGVAGVPAGTPASKSVTAVRRENGDWKIDQR